MSNFSFAALDDGFQASLFDSEGESDEENKERSQVAQARLFELAYGESQGKMSRSSPSISSDSEDDKKDAGEAAKEERVKAMREDKPKKLVQYNKETIYPLLTTPLRQYGLYVEEAQNVAHSMFDFSFVFQSAELLMKVGLDRFMESPRKLILLV